MKLHEYQSKQIFARYGIPIPEGEVAATPQEARAIAERLGTPVVIKAQVLVGGRGKAGGIKIAQTPQEAEGLAARILSLQIKGLPVRKVLVARAVDIRQEIYLGIVVDRAASRPVMMASSEGGVEIEEVARTNPEAIKKVHIDPFVGLRSYQTLWLAKRIGLPGVTPGVRTYRSGVVPLFRGLRCVAGGDQPLVITPERALLALDAKIVLDDNGLFRHPDLAALRDVDEETPSERIARGWPFLCPAGRQHRLYGQRCGAGDGHNGHHSVLRRDARQLPGHRGGARAERVATALRLILADPKVKAVLFNIFGGITRCDEVARGIISVLEEIRPDLPIVARLVGTNEEEGRQILESSGFRILTARTLVEAAQKAVAAAQGA